MIQKFDLSKTYSKGDKVTHHGKTWIFKPLTIVSRSSELTSLGNFPNRDKRWKIAKDNSTKIINEKKKYTFEDMISFAEDMSSESMRMGRIQIEENDLKQWEEQK